jgi:hypothetical protein
VLLVVPCSFLLPSSPRRALTPRVASDFGQLSLHLFQLAREFVYLPVLLRVLLLLFKHHPVEPLDGGERHAVGVNGRDVQVVRAEVEGGFEVLRDWANMFDRAAVRLVAPGLYGKRVEFVQDRARVDGREV